jgi:uncharacterized protein (TIGR03083 family)
MDLRPWIADERRRVAALIETLTPEQLATPSLCGAWTVHDVAAHLLMPLVTPMSKVMIMMIAGGLDVDKANVKLTASVARRSAREIADGLRRGADHRFKPPGMDYEAPLNDLLVHQGDLRRPLGLAADLDPERVRVCLDFAVNGPGSSRGRGKAFEGLRLEATDLDWSHGSGPPVLRGTGEALLMARNGRPQALADLDGDGAELLRSRLRQRA